MKWFPDRTGRFTQRPHYDPAELDHECEAIVSGFLQDRHGSVTYPMSTDDLTVLVERDTSALDLYADLSAEGEDVEGATDFFADKKPAVYIAEALSVQDYRQNRLRTTLTHEYGHVRFHGFLWDFGRTRLMVDHVLPGGPRCRRETILRSPNSDWMEWQAGYVSGALLMPISTLQKLVHAFFRERGLYGSAVADSDEGRELVLLMADSFAVSRDAATVRLSQLGHISKESTPIPLFRFS